MIDLTKRIFITGSNGFIGANLLHWLVLHGASDIHILLRKNADTTRIAHILDRVTVHTFSLEKREETLEYMRIIKPNIVFHIAAAGTAVGRVPLTIEDLITANTIGSINLMDASFETGSCECFINTGSSSEYGRKYEPMREGDILEPNNLYGISKSGATQYASYLGKNKGLPIATYRIFAAYGPHEDSKRLIPTLLTAFRDNITPKLSSPYSVRDFIHVEDIILSYMESDKAVQSPGDIINLGTGREYSIAEVVSVLQEIFTTTLTPEYGSIVQNQIEPIHWVADNTKMKEILGVMPRSLKQGLESTLQWREKSL